MQKFKIKNRYGLEIVGDVLIPEKSIGLCFVLHGLGGFRTQNEIQAIAQTFLRNNYTVVNFDATNSKGESGGEYEDATMQKHYEDLLDVISWSKSQNWYQQHFIVSGFSLGGYAAMKYGEEYPKEVRAVFGYAPVVSGELSFEASRKFKPKEFKEWQETGWQTRISKSKPGWVKKIPWSHMEERLKHDLRPKASHLTMPVLIIVGENDESCPPDHQKILYDLLPSQKEMRVVKDAPHTFRTEEHLNQLKKILDAWIRKIC